MIKLQGEYGFSGTIEEISMENDDDEYMIRGTNIPVIWIRTEFGGHSVDDFHRYHAMRIIQWRINNGVKPKYE